MGERTIKVVIADDHPVMRDGLSAIFRVTPGFSVVGTAGSGKQAVEICLKEWPDVLLTDVRMPDGDGFSTLEKVRKALKSVRVILLAGMPLQEEVEKARAMGASGYLSKTSSRQTLTEAARSAVADTGKFLTDHFEIGERRVLTGRELEILKLVSAGKSADEIGAILAISKETVRGHLKSIHVKLDAHSNAGAVGTAYKTGLLMP